MAETRRFTDWDEPGTVQVTQPMLYSVCKPRTPGEGYPSCSAFERIPIEILANCYDHRDA